jgi:LEA14-like dessication related protein
MKNKAYSSYLILGAVITALFSCRALKEPEYKGINNLRLTNVGLNQSVLSLEMNYFNPNHSAVKLKEAEGDAWMDSTYLGHFRMDTLIHIFGNSDFSVPVKLDMDMKYALQNIANAIFNTEVILKIDGKAKVGKGVIFIRYPIHYEGRQNLSELFK